MLATASRCEHEAISSEYRRERRNAIRDAASVRRRADSDSARRVPDAHMRDRFRSEESDRYERKAGARRLSQSWLTRIPATPSVVWPRHMACRVVSEFDASPTT
jgi:hypothetical protein